MRKGLIGSSGIEIRKRSENKCVKTEFLNLVGGEVMHYPTLETVMMVEDTIKKIGPVTLSQIHRSTEKQVMWGTLKLIISYLESRNMISCARNGQVVWIYNPKLVAKYRRRKDLEWRG
jgi:hypothetical protein